MSNKNKMLPFQSKCLSQQQKSSSLAPLNIIGAMENLAKVMRLEDLLY